MTESKSCVRPVFVYILVAVLQAAVAGCSARSGTVEGTVSVDGQPINSGIVSILEAEARPGERNSSQGIIHPDGTYQVTGVPVGPVKVSIMPSLRMAGSGRGGRGQHPLPPAMRKKEAPVARTAAPVAIPSKYRKFDTSGLTLTVHGGKNQFDIVMTSK